MKKKFLAGLALLMACVPFVSVSARTVGEEVNYFTNDADVSTYNSREDGWDEVGIHGYYLATDSATDSKGNAYSKVIFSFNEGESSLTTLPTDNIMTGSNSLFSRYAAKLRLTVTSPYAKADSDGTVIVDMATDEDMARIVGNNTGTITLTDSIKNMLYSLTGYTEDYQYAYLYTKTAGSTANTYKAIKITISDGKVTAAEWVERAASEGPATGVKELSYLIPVVYMNEGYTCDTSVQADYACYSCPDSSDSTKTTYIWSKKGSQDSKCTEVTTVTKKSKCVTAAKTGVDNYLVPVAIVLGVSLIVLTVVKRKDAFRAV